jgi:hypothetical protein
MNIYQKFKQIYYNHKSAGYLVKKHWEYRHNKYFIKSKVNKPIKNKCVGNKQLNDKYVMIKK